LLNILDEYVFLIDLDVHPLDDDAIVVPDLLE
jgi:hypothetical protein